MSISKEDLLTALAPDFPYQEDLDVVVDFLTHQGIASIEDAKDFHIELNEEAMFDWIYEDGDSTPTEIKNAPDISQRGNILIEEDGTCIFWYALDSESPPYNPYSEEIQEEMDLD